MESPYLTVDEVAHYYRKPVKTIRKWREVGYGPIPVKVGINLLYHVDEINRFDAELKAQAERQAS